MYCLRESQEKYEGTSRDCEESTLHSMDKDKVKWRYSANEIVTDTSSCHDLGIGTLLHY